MGEGWVLKVKFKVFRVSLHKIVTHCLLIKGWCNKMQEGQKFKCYISNLVVVQFYRDKCIKIHTCKLIYFICRTKDNIVFQAQIQGEGPFGIHF